MYTRKLGMHWKRYERSEYLRLVSTYCMLGSIRVGFEHRKIILRGYFVVVKVYLCAERTSTTHH